MERAASGTSRPEKSRSWSRSTSRARAGDVTTTPSLEPRRIEKMGPYRAARRAK